MMAARLAGWLLVASFLSVVALGLTPASAAQPGAKERIVIQVSDDNPKTWNQALNVAQNLKASYGKDNVEIQVIAFGHGIGMVTLESQVGNRVADTIAEGTPVYACMNTMRGRKIPKDGILPKVAYVPAGIVEIVKKQREGWAVVRP